MKWKILIISAFVVCSLNLEETHASVDNESPTYHYEVKEFEVPVDHFNILNDKTFKIRYLYNDSFVDENSDVRPIFFYTGGEGDIEHFSEHTTFQWELAIEQKAYVVFAEHRYYGKSLPFGETTFNVVENLSYLTVEQTLEDYADLIHYLSEGKSTMPVVAFGGSYGGMLAAWFRMKYPHLVVGALASSAPILQLNGVTPCDASFKVLTSVFTNAYSANCSWNIQQSWDVIKNLSTTDDGRKQLNDIFNFCNPLQLNDSVLFLEYLESVYFAMAMVNYPYDTEFLAPVPGNPVRHFCMNLREKYFGIDLMDALQKAISVYSNYTGTTKCLDINSAYPPTIDVQGWGVQTCIQIVQPQCSKDTMFMDREFNFKNYSDQCFNKYKFRPKLDELKLRYGGDDLSAASNIIFSNGLLDVWSAGGVLHSDNDKISVIIIPDGAHHSDLRAAHPKDSASVKEAREQETQIIKEWISQAQKH